MADKSRKTEPMARAANVASVRKTERMGIERDTIRDLPPVEPAAPATPLPRGTIPMAHAPRGKGPGILPGLLPFRFNFSVFHSVEQNN